MGRAALLFLFPALCGAQLPEFYKRVARVSWVVTDLDKVLAGWSKLGLANLERHGDVDLPAEYRGRPSSVKIRWATGWMGDVAIDYIQPLGGANAYTDFLARHGDGILALLHQAPSSQEMEAEIQRLGGLGVGVLQRGTVEDVRWAYLDTEPQGKYVLGLYAGEPPRGAGPKRITQFAFVARDLEAVSAFWRKLGFPEITTTRPQLHKLEYRGRPASFEQVLGWQRHGSVAYEWCPPPPGENVYNDFLKAHGEGVQHLGFSVADIDKAVAEAGYPVSQSGGWGEEGKQGSGRFAYIDTDPIGGVTIEFLWSFR